MATEGDGDVRPNAETPENQSVFDQSRVPRWWIKAVALFWFGWVVVYIGTGVARSLRSLLIVVLV
jgi:hypothetical protein